MNVKRWTQIKKSWKKKSREILGSHGGDGTRGGELFCKLSNLFYDRYKREEVIDERLKQDFIDKIPRAPILTEDEREVLGGSMGLVEELSDIKRIAGTVNESVEKYIHHPEGGGVGWGKTVAIVNCPAVKLFTEIWVLTTYDDRRRYKDTTHYLVWENLDGTRGLQYTLSVGACPAGSKRVFSSFGLRGRRGELLSRERNALFTPQF